MIQSAMQNNLQILAKDSKSKDCAIAAAEKSCEKFLWVK